MNTKEDIYDLIKAQLNGVVDRIDRFEKRVNERLDKFEDIFARKEDLLRIEGEVIKNTERIAENTDYRKAQASNIKLIRWVLGFFGVTGLGQIVAFILFITEKI